MTDLPQPETRELGRYLEDTITIDWQTPRVTECAKGLIDGIEAAGVGARGGETAVSEARVRTIFEFVRDEIDHSMDVPTEAQTCSASEVLKHRTGLCYSKSHLLAGLLRFAGFPTGFCYVRIRSDDSPERFVLHGFNAVYWAPSKDWFYLDARGNRDAAPPAGEGEGQSEGQDAGGPNGAEGTSADGSIATECRLEPPFSLAFWPEADRGEAFLPLIYKRPAKRIIDLLERAPSFEAILKNLPDAI